MEYYDWKITFNAPSGVYKAGRVTLDGGTNNDASVRGRCPATAAMLDVLHQHGWYNLLVSLPEDLNRTRQAGGFRDESSQMVTVRFAVQDPDPQEQADELSDALREAEGVVGWSRFEFRTMKFLETEQKVYRYDTERQRA